MSSQQHKHQILNSVLWFGLLALLGSCGSTSALESMVRADPDLVKGNISSSVPARSPQPENAGEQVLETETKISPVEKTETDNEEIADNPKSETDVAIRDNSENIDGDRLAIPNNFPADFPLHPEISLKEVKLNNNSQSGMITWASPRNIKEIAEYYQTELTANDWNIVKPITQSNDTGIVRAIASKDNLKLHLTILSARDRQTGKFGSNLSVIYEPTGSDIATSDLPPTTEESTVKDSETTPQPQINKQKDKPQKQQQTKQEENTESPSYIPEEISEDIFQDSESIPDIGYTLLPGADFEDLDDAPEQLNEPLESVAALGILSPHTRDGNIETSTFAPNAVITRGEYARWLIAVNNRYHEGDPGKKIYVANNTNEPAFQDVKPDNPDFGAIQGLAEAGLVPSRLTQDSKKLLFRPNAPLTREDLIAWKVPLDTRQALPQASIEAIEESWGFQDAANIDSSAVRALYADYQNGDRSNIRRIFGFTTLFQPKKPVTRAEAATSLWYFGFQGDGVTAQEILEAETELESNS